MADQDPWEHGTATAEADPWEQPTQKQEPQGHGVITNLLSGIGGGALRTLYGASDLIRRGEMAAAHAMGVDVEKIPPEVRSFVGLDRNINTPEVQALTESRPGIAENVGRGAETAAEFMVPAARIAKLKGLAQIGGAEGIMARAALQAITAAGVAGVQTGGNPAAMTSAAALGGGGSAALEALPAAVRGLATASENPAVKDAVGLASPRASHALNLLRRVLGSERIGPTPAPAEAPPPSRIVPGEAPPPERPDWRQDVVSELQPKPAPEPPPAPVSTVQALSNGTPPPSAAQNLADELGYKPPAEAPAPATNGKPNPYESLARSKKATAIARFLYMDGQGIPYEDARLMNPQHWRLAAEGAGVPNPSPATTKAALAELQKLEEMHRIAQQMAEALNE